MDELATAGYASIDTTIREAGVADHLDRVAKETAQLEEVAQRLLAAIEPVLVPETDERGFGRATEDRAKSQVVLQLEHHQERLAHITWLLGGALERVNL